MTVVAVVAESVLPPLSWAPPHPQYHLQMVFFIVVLVVPVLVGLARVPRGRLVALAFLLGNAGLSAFRYTRYPSGLDDELRWMTDRKKSWLVGLFAVLAFVQTLAYYVYLRDDPGNYNGAGAGGDQVAYIDLAQQILHGTWTGAVHYMPGLPAGHRRGPGDHGRSTARHRADSGRALRAPGDLRGPPGHARLRRRRCGVGGGGGRVESGARLLRRPGADRVSDLGGAPGAGGRHLRLVTSGLA